MNIKRLVDEYRLKKHTEMNIDLDSCEKSQVQYIFSAAELEERRLRELEKAKQRYTKIEKKQREQNSRPQQLKVIAPIAEVSAVRDSHRLHTHTKSSVRKAHTTLELVSTMERTKVTSAHHQPVAFGARDLNVVGGMRRATPVWRQEL
jgi:hypothetical protein